MLITTWTLRLSLLVFFPSRLLWKLTVSFLVSLLTAQRPELATGVAPLDCLLTQAAQR